jgi:hypothetical protein
MLRQERRADFGHGTCDRAAEAQPIAPHDIAEAVRFTDVSGGLLDSAV